MVVINFTSPTNYTITVDGQTDTFDTSTYNTIVVDTGGGSDSLTVNLSSLADTATLKARVARSHRATTRSATPMLRLPYSTAARAIK